MLAISRCLDMAVTALATLAAAFLIAICALLCVDVFVRYLGWASMNWIGDLGPVSLFAITFLAAPWVLRDKSHIAVDSLVKILPAQAQFRVRQGTNLLGAALSGVMCFYSFKMLLASYSAGTMVYRMLVYPQWWVFILPPLTFTLMALLFTRHAVQEQ